MGSGLAKELCGAFEKRLRAAFPENVDRVPWDYFGSRRWRLPLGENAFLFVAVRLDKHHEQFWTELVWTTGPELSEERRMDGGDGDNPWKPPKTAPGERVLLASVYLSPPGDPPEGSFYRLCAGWCIEPRRPFKEKLAWILTPLAEREQIPADRLQLQAAHAFSMLVRHGLPFVCRAAESSGARVMMRLPEPPEIPEIAPELLPLLQLKAKRARVNLPRGGV